MGEPTCVRVFGISSLDVTVVFVSNQLNLRHMFPSGEYIPIKSPNSPAVITPAINTTQSQSGLRRFILSGGSLVGAYSATDRTHFPFGNVGSLRSH